MNSIPPWQDRLHPWVPENTQGNSWLKNLLKLVKSLSISTTKYTYFYRSFFSSFCLGQPKWTEKWFKKSKICPIWIWCQSATIRGQLLHLLFGPTWDETVSIQGQNRQYWLFLRPVVDGKCLASLCHNETPSTIFKNSQN